MITLVRWAVAYVFVVSGTMKLMNPELANTFIQLRLPYPEQLMMAVAVTEVVCGILILINRGTRLAVMPLMGIMVAALILTKIPLLSSGFMDFAFGARLDIVMLLLLFVLHNHRGILK
ncbi:DoxX family protein [Siminovitchia fortis]|uniref:DoxX family protein n=1 Tax=Siminovitchia fortis TaxID=254758 RepID=A0A443IUW8_9BACI|nr:DoxX family protein [Siminovitchia fortis]RWR11873.1 DoxX family protein [Siminovitchia fortis]WHY81846.1 DoxX family protein [Siminovitchia fortis]